VTARRAPRRGGLKLALLAAAVLIVLSRSCAPRFHRRPAPPAPSLARDIVGTATSYVGAAPAKSPRDCSAFVQAVSGPTASPARTSRQMSQTRPRRRGGRAARGRPRVLRGRGAGAGA